MKILFVGICSSYTDGMTYQDQMMVKQCLKDGQETYYISNAQEFKNGILTDVPESEKILPDGLRFWQVKYDFVLCKFLSGKIRACKKLGKIIESIAPDVIYVHGPNSVAIHQVFQYLDKHPEVKFFADSHADYYTSGTNWVSRTFLHKMIYKGIYHKCLKYTEKIWCISKTCIQFANDIYDIPEEKTELYPLGGFIMPEQELKEMREQVRKNNQWDDKNIVFLQAGKMDEKKCLVQALKEFVKTTNPNWRYVVIGNIANDIKESFEKLCSVDKRIHYLGWKNGDEIIQYLSGCDVYVQPGKGSAIAQNALCVGAVVALNHLVDYEIFVDGNGWLLESPEDLRDVFHKIEKNDVDFLLYREKSMKIAHRYLDYQMLTRRIYVEQEEM